MPLPRTPLDPATLSPLAQKSLGAGPGKLMAARGLAPLQDPVELVSVLYQLTLDGEASIRDAARTSLDGLPERIISGALVSPKLDPRVIDVIAGRAAASPQLFEQIVLAPATADATIADLAAKAAPREVDLIAQNEKRLLRFPDIIAAIYVNPRARMSTVDRAVELAVRNNVKVPGIAAWDELARHLLGGPGTVKDPVAPLTPTESDALFARIAHDAAAVDDSALTTGDVEAMSATEDGSPPGDEAEVDVTKVPISQMTVPMKIRLAMIGNAFARATLVRDPIRMVALAAIKAPGVKEMEIARYAGNHSLSDDVIKFIANRREWTRLYGVKLSLIQNPKTPIPDAIRLMPHLREKDLRIIARSKGVPSAVVANARKLVLARTRPDDKKK
jgi:hypothetical protein